MKKILLVLLLAIPTLSSCSSQGKISITFGNMSTTDVIELDKTNIDGILASENSLMVSYYKDTHCACWPNFHNNVLKKVISENNLRVYAIEVSNINKDLEDKGFSTRTDAPVFYIIKDGKVAKKFDYESSTGFYSSPNAFMNQLQLDCVLPSMFYVTKEYLDEQINKNQRTDVFFIRNQCPDCTSLIPNVLTPYFQSHKGKLLTLDLQTYYDDKTLYQEIKDHYHLSESSDSKFGYSKGVVPTLQIYNNGVLTDSCVYLNDELSDNKSTIINSYYTTERTNSLPFLANVKESDRVLKNKTIPEQERDLSNEYLKRLHLPIITGFLNTYYPN